MSNEPGQIPANSPLGFYGESAVSSDNADPDFSVVRILNTLLRRRAWIIIPTLALSAYAIAQAIGQGRTYTSIATFVREAGSQSSSVSSIAAQFGLAVGGPEGLASPLLYPQLIKSPQFLRPIVLTKYEVDSAGRTLTRSLVDFFNPEARDPKLRVSLAVESLMGSVDVGVAPRTGLITLSVTAVQPRLAQQIAEEILLKINDLNVQRRRGRVGAERQFIERRLAEVGLDLRRAENTLQEFLRQNRDYTNSPMLTFEHTRLNREVVLQHTMYTSLSQAYEQAKIEEVRDTPLISVIGEPEVPVHANARGRLFSVILWTGFGFVMGVALALGVDALRKKPAARTPEAEELAALGGAIRSDIRRGRLVRALFG